MSKPTMTLEAILTQYLHEHIPITTALGCTAQHVSSEKVILLAPFVPNINHKKTVFGGSLHAIATLACWSLLYTNFLESNEKVEIVISGSQVNYKIPVISDFSATSIKPPLVQWEKFLAILSKKGKSRIVLSATINQQERMAVEYRGEFVVIKR